MDLDRTCKKIAREEWDTISWRIFGNYRSGMSLVHFKLERSLARAIAAEAWSQVVGSIISGNPPSDMSQEYYYSRPDSGFDYLQEQLKHLEIHKYKLGTENIQARMRSDMDSLLVESIECEGERGFPCADSEDSTEPDSEVDFTELDTYSQVVQANEYGDDEVGLRLGNFEDSTESNTYSEVVRANKDEDLQVIENIQGPIRTPVHFEVVQANEDEDEDQQIDNIQLPIRSPVCPEVVQADEDEQGIENIQCPIRSAVHSGVVQENEDEGQQIENIQLPIRSAVRSEVVQSAEDEDRQGIENIQCPIRSAVQANQDEDQRGIEKIQSPVRRAVHVEANKSKYEHLIEHLVEFGVHYKVVQANNCENEVTTMTLEDIQAKGLSILFELLELVRKGDENWKEQPTPRSQVLELIKHLHDDGINTTRIKLEGLLLHLKRCNIEKDTPIQYMKKYVELISIISYTNSCQRTLCMMRGKVEGNPCGYWEAMQANKQISNLFEELLEFVEDGDVHVGEKPNMRFKVLKLIKVLHHYGVDTIRAAVKKALGGVNQEYGKKDWRIWWSEKNALEVMLRICDIETCQKTLYRLITTTGSGQVLYT